MTQIFCVPPRLVIFHEIPFIKNGPSLVSEFLFDFLNVCVSGMVMSSSGMAGGMPGGNVVVTSTVNKQPLSAAVVSMMGTNPTAGKSPGKIIAVQLLNTFCEFFFFSQTSTF